jgi:RND family efflux transporter MFP subunit
MMKKLLAAVIALAVLGFLGWRIYEAISSSAGGPERGPRSAAVAVEVTPVVKGTIRDVGSFTGSLLPQSRFVVAPKIAGRLEELLVNIGDHVRDGQLIAVLDDEEYAQQAEQAQAGLTASKAYLAKAKESLLIAQEDLATETKKTQSSLEATKARYEDAQSKSERLKQLLDKKLVSQEEYETAQTVAIQASSALDTVKMQVEELGTKERGIELKRQDVALAEADVTQKEAALKAAEVRLSYAKIHVSWQDGKETRVVGERFVDEGALLTPNAAIVSILDIDPLMAVIHIIERDYQKIRLEQQAIITTDALPDESFNGTVVRIAPLLVETSRQARVEIEIKNPKELLKPGMFVRVEIQFAERKDVPIVPLASLARRNDQQGIFLVDPQKKEARFTPVELGIADAKFAEVVKPPVTGLVVTLGHHLLEDGSAVTLPEPKDENRQQDPGKQGNPAAKGPQPGGRQ